MRNYCRIPLLLLIAFGLVLAGLAVAADKELVYKSSVWARKGTDGRLVAVEKGVFSRCDEANLVLLEVGTFTAGEDGLCWFDIDVQVTAPSGEVVLSQKGLLGDNGHVSLENGVAGSPYGIFEGHLGLLPGTYRMSLHVFDKIGGAELTVTEPFELTDELCFKQAVFARAQEDGSLSPMSDNSYSRGEDVNLVLLNVGTFARGEDGKQRFDISLEVKDPGGEQILFQENMLGENGHTSLEDGIARSPYGVFQTNVELAVGEYTITLTLMDRIAGKQVSATRTFVLK